ncbi:MAG: polysulfide reductase NrfD [Elusimicrobia bacterium]|nr:polysulfide reductase NrfD [Elusimicrobiota bacterium]
MNPASTTSGKHFAPIVLWGVTLVGLTGIFLRFFGSGEPTHLTQIIPWGVWVATYIYFIGLSAGGFIVSSLAYGFGMERFARAGRLALLQAFVCLLVAMGVIFVDLGHPWRSLRLPWQANPTSVMAWLFYLYNIYFALVAVELYIAVWRPQRKELLRRLALVGLPLAVIVHGGVGAIFATVKAHPVWHSGLLPVLFVVSAVASGGALLTLLAFFFLKASSERDDLINSLARFSIAVLIVEAAMVGIDHLVASYGGIPERIAAYHLITAGPFPWVFWGGEVLIGFLIPLYLVCAARPGSAGQMALAAACIVAGTFAMRLNIVIPPLAHPAFPELPGAIHHMRWSASYLPSFTEWAVVLAAFSAVIWGILAGRRLFSFEGGSHAGEN